MVTSQSNESEANTLTHSLTNRLIPSLLIAALLLPVVAEAGNGKIRRAVKPIPGQYLVVLDPDLVTAKEVPGVAYALSIAHQGSLRLVMKDAALMFSVGMSESRAQALARHPKVLSVEENGETELSVSRPLGSADRFWHLDRLDQRGPIASGDDYFKYCETGTGVVVYLPDTGIMKNHTEFRAGQVKNGVCFAADCGYAWPGESVDYGTLPCGSYNGNYGGGHGTAVASIVGGRTVGVAPGVDLVPIRVMDCNARGTTEHLAWGLDWIKSCANPYRHRRPAVVSMSTFAHTRSPDCQGPPTETLCSNGVDDDCDGDADIADNDCNPAAECVGGQNSFRCNASAVEHVVRGLILDQYEGGNRVWNGIPVVVSANNHNQSQNTTTPARMAYSNQANFPIDAHVISVGGVNELDQRWECVQTPGVEPDCLTLLLNGQYRITGSNYGPTVDIFAPAHFVESAHIASSTSYRSQATLANAWARSGTSFAAPIVAGVAARLLYLNPSLTPAQVWSSVMSSATRTNGTSYPGTRHEIDPITHNDRIIYRPLISSCAAGLAVPVFSCPSLCPILSGSRCLESLP